MTGHSRSKNGVASLAYVPVISIKLAKRCHKYRDCPVKPGNDDREKHSRDAIRTRVIVTRQEFLALRTDLRQRMPPVVAGSLTICALSHECKKRRKRKAERRSTRVRIHRTCVRRAPCKRRSPIGVPPRLSACGSISSQGSTWARLRDTRRSRGGPPARACATSSDAPRAPLIVPPA